MPRKAIPIDRATILITCSQKWKDKVMDVADYYFDGDHSLFVRACVSATMISLQALQLDEVDEALRDAAIGTFRAILLSNLTQSGRPASEFFREKRLLESQRSFDISDGDEEGEKRREQVYHHTGAGYRGGDVE